ncbi:arylformamidase [Bacillus sp. FJAT-45066]|uniref:arylformamidase n=1 Tax=Bacillus sp. FJAT-45066 TaxID=2011010 RepID=UPI000BB8AE7F|nr:arylformamidase [Bacillus sp. FJAT-45066]
MKILDISRSLHAKTPTWPGDTPFQFNVNWTKEETGSVNIGSVTMSVHTGTHVDSPFHFDSNGQKVSDMNLVSFVGPAYVIDVQNIQKIKLVDVKEKLATHSNKRILFKTNAWLEDDTFPTSIPTLKLEVIEYLHQLHVPLIGLDLPSVDELDSKELPIHNKLHECNIMILEGLDLSSIYEGEYELIALPLKLDGADGSPVRAILKKEKDVD